MSTNISKQKRDDLLAKIEQIKTYIQKSEYDQNITTLLQYLNELTKEVNGKKYGLVFEEHREKIDEQLENSLPVFTEEKDLFIDNGGQMNFLIEGDNLASLKLLEKTHKGKIDVIYIDPPYNTGNKDFVYDDSFVDGEDSFRHSKWCSFITKRLEIAQKLLKETGIIFISIDDNEYAPLKIICDDIFGETNRISTHHIQVRYDNKSLNEKKAFQECLEYVLIYAKKGQCFIPNQPTEDYSIEPFVYEIKETGDKEEITLGKKKVTIFKKGNYEITKHDKPSTSFLKGTWASGSVVKGNTSGKFFETYLKPRKEIDGLETLYKVEGIGEDGLGFRYFTGPLKATATQGIFYSGIPLSRLEELKTGSSKKYKTISNYYDFSADFGNIRQEGGVPFNSGKKPIKMIRQFLNYHKSKNITVLDFFAGSGSTGHAVLSLNNEDNGKRKFILCTNNENNICRDITYARMVNILTKNNLSGSLKYFRVDFIPITEKEYYEYADKLLLNIRELVELENALNFTGNKKIAIVLTDTELEEFCSSINEKSECHTAYIGHNVLLTKEQKSLFKVNNIKIKIIPEYYYPELNG
ncbi:MAG: site-specific DNA-methyltransferase [Treponema sp.]|nr:site-specific DNA-methyltransferase [Treponema sp.]